MKRLTGIERRIVRRRQSWSHAPRPGARHVGAAATFAMALASTMASAAPPERAPLAPGADAARSNPARTECLSAHRAAQELKQNGKLVEAQQELLICSSASCPGPVISDCGAWIGELEQATPTLVFEVQVDGKEADEAKVFLDGDPVNDRSHLVKVNPGRHVVRAELPPFEPHEEVVFTVEGQRMRPVPIHFESPKPAPPPIIAAPAPAISAEAPSSRPVPVIVYPLLGIGVAGLAAFGVFGGMGRAKQSDLEQQCAGHCSDSDLQPMKTSYLIGDVSLGAGVAALVGAAFVYFTRPVEKPRIGAALSLDVGPVGSAVRRNDSWGASATVKW